MLEASIAGSGDIIYYGNPKDVKKNVAGSGKVIDNWQLIIDNVRWEDDFASSELRMESWECSREGDFTSRGKEYLIINWS